MPRVLIIPGRLHILAHRSQASPAAFNWLLHLEDNAHQKEIKPMFEYNILCNSFLFSPLVFINSFDRF